MLNLFRLYWRLGRLEFGLLILFFLIIATFFMAIGWKDNPETDVWGFLHGIRDDQELLYSTTKLIDWMFFFPWLMWVGHSSGICDIYRLQKLHWLLPASQKEKYASLIIFGICKTVVFQLAAALTIYWVRIPLSSLLSIDQPVEKGWLWSLLAWYFRWPTLVFYLWVLTGCYYLSARSKKNIFVTFVPMALVAVYPNCALYIESFWDWAPYLAAVLAVASVINIRLGYRRFQQLEMVLQFTPKVL